ncbi:formyltetrahydrofolate-dependent phosphoribosylglycinamide formyltransferase [Gillisia mitskevichiae]|uniref:Phosphoribosylglycinamide formyltransferase n=1 Tax=Gillisia mitskevichiae TaxID=270921 RepID=A0A495PY11_9FLAO|nr:phosphoribosylglycinamide formyltransferase [Gillisia mitskevichiae]RKS55306.1 formyltetrahydrofolate-dependent phosphoribosylglycinamide formyltransferase [Gillisia mitskevichiae]
MSSQKRIIPKKIVVFASGSGSNAENIIRYFKDSNIAEVVCVLSNKSSAKVLDRAQKLNVTALYFDRDAFYKTNDVLHILEDTKPDLIVLAGFLWLFPSAIIAKFPNKVINLHPALLPKYGGKGMFGENVHRAVLDNKEIETGITIHYVNEKYDDGQIIFQKGFPISSTETLTSLTEKIHELEHRHFPKVIEKLLEAPTID